mmetsp:Transcript_7991/g.15586  ORF Transcript_7991/g.15586 Transcript_7991/m.15586 type:complete len:137 (+) Transcript_7991:166-576(+)
MLGFWIFCVALLFTQGAWAANTMCFYSDETCQTKLFQEECYSNCFADPGVQNSYFLQFQMSGTTLKQTLHKDENCNTLVDTATYQENVEKDACTQRVSYTGTSSQGLYFIYSESAAVAAAYSPLLLTLLGFLALSR